MSLSDDKFFRQLSVQRDLRLSPTPQNDAWITSEKAQNIKKWITYYRRNWDLFAEEVLGIKLYPVQKYKIHLMGIADVFWDVSSRGASKSFLCGLGAIIAMCLYPNSEIIITANVSFQGQKLAEEKIRDEIVVKLSPYLRYLYEHGFLTIKTGGSNDAYVYTIKNTLNDSSIGVVTCSESARGTRATMIIYEEARLLKKSLIDSVFEFMGHNRPAPYMLNKKYQTSRWQETTKSLYITSTRYEWEWFIRAYRQAVAYQFTKVRETYVTVAEDFYTAIWEGTRTWKDYRKLKRQVSPSDFLMEGLNETMGVMEDAFFNLKEFVENQEIEEAFVPPTNIQIATGSVPKFRKKGVDEIRIVAIDFAFANKTAKTGVDNDNTIIECVAGIWKGDHFERRVEYITQWEASDSTGAAWRVRELRQDFEADYIVHDIRAGGETVFNIMTEYREHPKRGFGWDAHGLTVADKIDYQTVSQAKLDDLKHRTVDPEAIPCLIPMIGSSDNNSTWWLLLRKQLELGNIKFLVPLERKRELLEDSGEFFKLQSEELAEVLAPYGETDLLIQEAVALNLDVVKDKIVLKEDRNKTKDRVVVLSYVNAIFDKIENAWNKQLQEKDDFDIDDLELVF